VLIFVPFFFVFGLTLLGGIVGKDLTWFMPGDAGAFWTQVIENDFLDKKIQSI
jgi:hypothetical protein